MGAQERRLLTVGTGLLIAVVLVVGVFRVVGRDVKFCRSVFADMAQGKTSVQRHIAWERLEALGLNIGQTYVALPDDQERARYRLAFIGNFSRGIHQAGRGAGADVLTNWRTDEDLEGRRIVLADHAVQPVTLAFRLSRTGRRQVEALYWQ